ncbi:hypothetical protein [Arsenicicoccus dermatophilus]|uniref:hypothetical protein n=1 Tax=Arsenicicoccus dermatophilus TaxID=1076331 RepID=UPI001F4CC8A3|nr:hypothetical protein [Arsenicicoccus dermatophilus]MCH8613714.1 hypothetical protein [Arsenicicoccus dermatophilus]
MPFVARRDRLVRLTWAAADTLAWVAAVLLATWVRYSFALAPVLLPSISAAALTSGAAYALVSVATGPYRKGHTRGSFEEVLDVTTTAVITGAGLLAWTLLVPPPCCLAPCPSSPCSWPCC